MEEIFETPIILVGAARSGTKMLRELIKLHPRVTGELYEEERVWCYGHKDRMYKRIEASELTESIRMRIRNHFRKKAHKYKGRHVIDKNTHNSLRVDFVKAIFPESPIIHIIRDGRAAAASFRIRWQQPLDWKYILRERAFPIKEVPYFLSRQIRYNWHRYFSGEKRAKLFGVEFDGIDKMLETHSLLEVCGRQWLECVNAILTSSERLSPDEYIEVRYEDIIRDPEHELRRLFDFLEIEHLDEVYKLAKRYVRSAGSDKWKRQITSQEIELLNAQIGEMQKRLGYM
jgi:hypothetical protein